jgi:hypothetical protein
VFKPVTVEEPAALDPAPPARNRFDPAYLWWRHERLHRTAMRDFAAAVRTFATQRDRLEADWLAAPPGAAEAFAVAERREEVWIEALGDLPDQRPAWVRRQWRGWNRAAGMAGDVETG